MDDFHTKLFLYKSIFKEPLKASTFKFTETLP